MRWGIVFSIPAAFESDLWSLPPLSNMRRLTRSDGGPSLEACYLFDYPPQSWREWQRVATIKVQIEHRLKLCKIQEYHGSDEVQGPTYTISELGKEFPAFVKFPAPLFPKAAGEQYSHLIRHAKRLHYEGLLNIERLIAVSWWFNDVLAEIDTTSRKGHQGPRQVMVVAKRAWEYAQEHKHEWRVKLPDSERKKKLSDAAHKAAAVKRDNPKRKEAAAMRKEGKTYAEIAEYLGVSLSTAKRWLKVNNKIKKCH